MEILDNTNENLNVLLKTNDMILLYFGSNACHVCDAIKPKLENMLVKYPNIKSYHVEYEKSPKISALYNIFTIPAIIFFIDGKENLRVARYINLLDLDRKISRYYSFYYET